MMRIKEAIQRRKLIQEMNDEWYAWEEENAETSTSPYPPAQEENTSISSMESETALLQFAQQLGSRMTDLQRRALRITWKRLSEAPRTSGRGTIHVMEKVFEKMAETSEVMPIFYKSAFLSCVEDKRRSKRPDSSHHTQTTPQTIKTVRDHAHLLVDFIDDIISLMFDNTFEKKSLNLEQIARAHLRLEPLGFKRSLWILFGESLAEIMFSQECVRAYPHAPSAWSLMSVTISDNLHAVAKKSRLLQMGQMSHSFPDSHGKKFSEPTPDLLHFHRRRISHASRRQSSLDSDDRSSTDHANDCSLVIAPGPEFPSSIKKHALASSQTQPPRFMTPPPFPPFSSTKFASDSDLVTAEAFLTRGRAKSAACGVRNNPKKKKKKKKPKDEDEDENEDEGELKTKQKAGGAAGAPIPSPPQPPPPQAPKPPTQGGIAGTHDPNYQTLAGIGADIFGADKQGGGGALPAAPKAPTQGGIAGTHDPNYQTLAGIGGDIFGADKAGGGGMGGGGGVKAPAAQGGVAGTFDPNYQTLAGIGGDIFGADKKDGGGGGGFGGGAPAPVRAPQAPQGKADTFDPNYQTLAAVNADIFGADKKVGGGGGGGGGGALPDIRAPAQGGKAGTFDPNYQTLAAVNQDIFGADKKKW